MIKTTMGLGSGMAILLGATHAFADFGREGQVALSADRLFGFTSSSYTLDVDPPIDTETDTSNTNVAFLGQGAVVSPHNAPRLSFDYFLTDGLSLGGALAFHSVSQDNDPGGDGSRKTFVISPRVGYAVMFNENVGIWPRGGLTFYTGSEDADFGAGLFAANVDASETGMALAIDLPLVIGLVDHFALVLGPALDLGLFGGGTIEAGPPVGDVDYDRKWTDISLYFGFVGYL